MDRKIDIDRIIWLVFLLFLFGGSLVKWLIQRFGRKKGEEAYLHGESSFMDEFKKILEGMVQEERPEIVIVEEKPAKKRPKHLKAKVQKEVTSKFVLKPEHKEGKEAITEVSLPESKTLLSRFLSMNELQKVIIMSEILGPPRAKRRHYRLF